MFGPNVRDANPDEYPFIVSIIRIGTAEPNLSNDHICTGSLITRQDVLTAAHCFDGEEIEKVQVIVGSIDLSLGTRYDIYWWITYNNWAALMSRITVFQVNDIANLRLLHSAPANINLGVLCHLPTSELYNKHVVIAAWGRNENHTVSHKMRAVDLIVLEMKDCMKRVKRLNDGKKIKVHERHICTRGDPFAVMYWGDSGGPVLYQNMIIAVHKSTIPFPHDLTNPRKLNMHTTINWYRNFINYVIDPDFDYIDM